MLKFKNIIGLCVFSLITITPVKAEESGSTSSCTAPSLEIVLGDVDFYESKNYALSTYRKTVQVNVSCSTPTQAWQILPYVKAIQITGGTINSINGSPGQSQTVYVSFTSVNGQAPGALFNENSPISGIGSQSLTAQVIFGKQLPIGAVPNANNYSLTTGGIPYGAVDLRGLFSLDIPLSIMY